MATWDRLPLISLEIEARLYGAIKSACEKHQCIVLALGGTENHVHLLVKLHPNTAQAILARDAKGASSHLISHEIAPNSFFRWQGSYASFAVEPGSLPRVIRYIENQKQHHSEGTVWPPLERLQDEASEL